MAFDAFLKLTVFDGESTDDKHKDWIEVLSYGLGIQQPTSATASSSGGATAERANFQDFTIVKALDKASPKLALACANGPAHRNGHPGALPGRWRQGEIHGIQVSSQCIVSSYHDGGSSGGAEPCRLKPWHLTTERSSGPIPSRNAPTAQAEARSQQAGIWRRTRRCKPLRVVASNGAENIGARTCAGFLPGESASGSGSASMALIRSVAGLLPPVSNI